MKKVLALLLVLINIVVFTSCSDSSDTENNSSQNVLQSVETKQDSFNLFPRGDKSSSSEATVVSTIPADDISEIDSSVSYDPSEIYPDSKILYPLSDENAWCYNALSEPQKNIYRRMNKIAQGMLTGFIIIGNGEMSDIVVAFSALRTDHPEYYWLSNRFACGYSGGSMAVAFDYKDDDINISYLCTKDERTEKNKQLKSAIEKFTADITEGMSEYDTELLLHDRILEKVGYDKAAAADFDYNPYAFTSYGALVDGEAVCEGYSRGLQLLLNYAGIECTLATGLSQDQGHMWNKVKIDDKWYNTDSTWNDDSTQKYHTYFNITDKMLLGDHKIYADYTSLTKEQLEEFQDFNISLPSCTSLDANYGMVNGTYIKSTDNFYDIVANGIYTAVQSGKIDAEFIYGEDCPLTFAINGDESVTSLLKEYDAISKANKELSRSKHINNVYISGIPGSKGFMLTW